jgi:hypothetical protein
MSPGAPTGVRQIYLDTRLGHESSEKPALCVRGRKYAHCVVIDFPVRVLRRPAKDFDTLRVTVHNGGEYPVARMIKHLREAGKRNGITIGAARLLDVAASDVKEFDEETITEEDEAMETPEGTTTAADTTASPTEEKTTVSTKKKGGAKKKAASKKTATLKAPKAAKKTSAKKTASKAPAKKQAAAKGDGLGKAGSTTRFICELIVDGKSNDDVNRAGEKAGKKFPKTYPQWYRNRLEKAGTIKKAAAK